MKNSKIRNNIITLAVFGLMFLGIVLVKLVAGKSWIFAHWYNDLFMAIAFAMIVSSIINLICLKKPIKMQNRAFIYLMTSLFAGMCIHFWESTWYDIMDMIYINPALYVLVGLVTGLICLSWCLIQEKSPYYYGDADYFSPFKEDVDYSIANYEKVDNLPKLLENMRFARIIEYLNPSAEDINIDIHTKLGSNMNGQAYFVKAGDKIVGYFIANETDDKQNGQTIIIPEFYTVWHDKTEYGMLAKCLLKFFEEHNGKYIRVAVPENKPHVENMEIIVNSYTDHNYSFNKDDEQLYIEFMSVAKYSTKEETQ